MIKLKEIIDIYDLILELWHILKPLEIRVVAIIMDRTIRWREKEAKIEVDYLSEKTGQSKSNIYRTLKILEQKKVIVRRKVNHDTFIGINPKGDFLEAISVKKHSNALNRRKKFKVLVTQENQSGADKPPSQNN